MAKKYRLLTLAGVRHRRQNGQPQKSSLKALRELLEESGAAGTDETPSRDAAATTAVTSAAAATSAGTHRRARR